MSSCNTTCPYCGVGCGVTAEVIDGAVVSVAGDPLHPANLGRLCVKGTTLAETLSPQGRLLQPSLQGNPVSWDSALALMADKIQSVLQQHGPEAIGFYLSGQLLTEDYYVANKLMKGFLGSANVDTNSRLCMSSAVAGYKRAFGADLVPCSYRDLEQSQLLVMVGSNAAWTHPVIYQRIAESRRRNPSKRIVVIDPRRTASCDIADLHLAITPGSDGFLFAGLLHWLQQNGDIDQAYIEQYTQGIESALAAVEHLEPSLVAAQTGLSQQQLLQFYQWFGEIDNKVTLYSQGINQSATGSDKCNAIINCHLATGAIGRAGCGPFSITGQPNAMGGREVGGMAHTLAAHMDFTPDNVDRVQRFWDAPAMAHSPGLKAVELFQAAADGNIKLLWIMATNPAVSLPASKLVRRALQNCDFVIVSDCVANTDTSAFADLKLPAMGWGEKHGSVTNSERCISRQRALLPPAGESRADWWIVTQLAQRLGFGSQFGYRNVAEIFQEHARLSGFENNGTRAFDISGLAKLSAEQYDQMPPVYWPVPDAGDSDQRQLLGDGKFYTPSGRAQFVAVTPMMPGSDQRHPLVLNTGRLRDQWHTMTRTGKVPKLMRHRDFFSLDINPEDAAEQGIAQGDLVALSNEFGAITALASLDTALPAGQVFSPIHWSDQFSGQACISSLIPSITDAVSGQPQSKFARVSLQRRETRYWGLLLTADEIETSELGYWSRIAVAQGYLTLFATDEPQAQPTAERLIDAASPTGAHCISYEDSSGDDYRFIGIEADRLHYALFLNRDQALLPRRDWLAGLLQAPLPTDTTSLLAGMDPAIEDQGRLVCTCWEVAEKQIGRAIVGGAHSLELLGQNLRCGTQCGSCVPELKRMLCEANKATAA